jgi:hypothetical protein
MPQFAFEPDSHAVEQLLKLPVETPSVVFDPGNPEYEIALVFPVKRGYGAHILRLIDHLQLCAQDPPVSALDAFELLRHAAETESQTGS